MCWRAGCLVLSLNIWQGESRGILPEPSQLLAKYSNTLTCKRRCPHIKISEDPYFPISFWLTYILSHRANWLTQQSVHYCSLAHLSGSTTPATRSSECCRTAASPDETTEKSFQVCASWKWIWKGLSWCWWWQADNKNKVAHVFLLKMHSIRLEQKWNWEDSKGKVKKGFPLLSWCFNFLVICIFWSF